MEETAEDDPSAAVREKARCVIREFHQAFGQIPPFNVEALASFRGLRSSEEQPKFSKDSEIAPQADGRVVLRVNRDRPLTRQRFSVAHEIGHTLFPEYQLSVRCRKATDRDWANPQDPLETLCDIAASQFLFPDPWFSKRAAEMTLAAAEIVRLAKDYQASPDATVRRLVEAHPQPLAAVFFIWKLKPTEIRQRSNDRHQQPMFADDRLPEPQAKLRVDYAVINDLFGRKLGGRIPKDKSVPCEGPIRASSLAQEPSDGTMFLDLGAVAGNFLVHALPIYTPEDSLGPDRGLSVVAILQPASR
jgi:hypothetical protein